MIPHDGGVVRPALTFRAGLPRGAPARPAAAETAPGTNIDTVDGYRVVSVA